jgi:hypothetical protein
MAHRCKNVKEIATFYKVILKMDLLVLSMRIGFRQPRNLFWILAWEIYWPSLKSLVKGAEVLGITDGAKNKGLFCYAWVMAD